ncbi:MULTISPECIES: DUF4250 domain-containing protein [Clostridium]|jgi:thermostable 8-oxoguanine DNA glycosylase|uniref:DUF4250 domain-containing protein n=1 Tax=Clostridium TaxID=1485 RepID=UPI00019B0185|nr:MULTISPECIES: DUF4250 domain-containing protein [Clostridium]EEH98434.1 hypothetical protein CSBG_02060 [Clostridium sp. 7_2_43FAA]MBS6502043.1 DUF4250 domain-containing protein [Clostridium sp.]MDU1568151.1 DUF4250 domain-containing protein [Clostridium sp.]MDU2682248.1 DUF4250 domain-containing protein [Clostridium sp.]MDU8965907.1 DUF4250 domain-containing protein [Clostridium sp.]
MDRESVLSMDPNILLSMINMKLRDFYSNLSALCEDIGVTEEELKEKLNSIGYKYKRDQNQFK